MIANGSPDRNIESTSCMASLTDGEQLSTQCTNWNRGPPSCAGCGTEIYDRLIVRVEDKLMHSGCVRCSSCGTQVSDVCFSDGNKVYCQTDFYRKFGGQCSGCSGLITPDESVRVAFQNVYHQACFVCTLCHVALQTGDKFYIREDNKLLCDHDLQKLSSKDINQSLCDRDCEPSRGRRLAINLTAQQRRILEHAYQTNPRPSRHVRQKLGMLTGIETRLLHLWFRTKRSKQRTKRVRNIRRGSGSHDSDLSDSETGTSLSSLPGSGDEIRNTTNDTAFPMNYTSDLSTVQNLITKSPYNGLENWLKHVDTLAVDAVPPNIELKASDFTADGEIRLPSNNTQYDGAVTWYQTQAGNRDNDNWISVM